MKELCIIGSGYMAYEHAMAALELHYSKIFIVGRSQESFNEYFDNVSIHSELCLISGGLNAWFCSEYFNRSMLHINAVAIEALKNVTLDLINQNVNKVLLEKPGALNIGELQEIKDASESFGCQIVIGYNRRQYASVRKLKEILSEQAVSSFEFEFTEWADQIDQDKYSKQALANWIKSNSAHVLDTVFYLAGGIPTEFSAISSGINQIKWHPQASIFVGSGLVGKTPFTYNSDWTSQGRWRIYFRTVKGKYVLEPMEKLGFIPKNSLTIESVNIDSEKSKPGLLKQIQLLEQNKIENFCSIQDQINLFRFIQKMQQPSNEKY